MKTHEPQYYILRWNPNISSFKQEHFDLFRERLATTGSAGQFDWSVYDWQKVRKDDVFIMQKVGTDSDCIAMCGKFVAKCFADEDWNPDRNKKKVHYAYLEIDVMFEYDDRLSAATMEKQFPSIDWHGGHSGVLISSDDGAKIMSIIDDVLKSELCPEESSDKGV